MTLALFTPLQLRGVRLPNRLVLSPMCQYSSAGGEVAEWHIAHLARFAMGGFGTVMVEATAIHPAGRITHGDLGIWDDSQISGLTRLASVLRDLGAVPAIQLGHAGRKACTERPWDGNGPLQAVAGHSEQPWPVVGASALAVGEGWQVPQELSQSDLAVLAEAWVAAARRADKAGFELLELHAAHGYLLHQFLSPFSNQRDDAYGGDLEGRMRWPLEVVARVREVWSEDKPLAVRISAVDGLEGGWSLEDSVQFAKALRGLGVDLIDCSSGGISGSVTAARVPRLPGFQVPYAAELRREAEIATMAVGLITRPAQAAEVIGKGLADLVAIGREALVQPNWPVLARTELGGKPDYDAWPRQVGWWLEKRDASIAASRG